MSECTPAERALLDTLFEPQPFAHCPLCRTLFLGVRSEVVVHQCPVEPAALRKVPAQLAAKTEWLR